jgi:hypothetical protein
MKLRVLPLSKFRNDFKEAESSIIHVRGAEKKRRGRVIGGQLHSSVDEFFSRHSNYGNVEHVTVITNY